MFMLLRQTLTSDLCLLSLPHRPANKLEIWEDLKIISTSTRLGALGCHAVVFHVVVYRCVSSDGADPVLRFHPHHRGRVQHLHAGGSAESAAQHHRGLPLPGQLSGTQYGGRGRRAGSPKSAHRLQRLFSKINKKTETEFKRHISVFLCGILKIIDQPHLSLRQIGSKLCDLLVWQVFLVVSWFSSWVWTSSWSFVSL